MSEPKAIKRTQEGHSVQRTCSAVPMLPENGWIVDVNFLTQISEAVHKTEHGQNEAVSHEMIEQIILELSRVGCLRICPPNATLSHAAGDRDAASGKD